MDRHSAPPDVVLVVEDDKQLSQLLVAQLRTLGYTPVEAEAGAAALDILRSRARVDVLLTDVMMPESIDGRQLAQEAVALRPAIKVILTSGYPVVVPVSGSEHPNATMLLRKPFRKAELARALNDVLASD